MSGPDFSVIIAVYNGAATLARAIDSVLAQSYLPLEIIIVDDGSADDTAAIAQRYGESVRYSHQDNAGVSVARNAGARIARGEWWPSWTPTIGIILIACGCTQSGSCAIRNWIFSPGILSTVVPTAVLSGAPWKKLLLDRRCCNWPMAVAKS